MLETCCQGRRKGTATDLRICPVCKNAQETVTHFLVQCPGYGRQRAIFQTNIINFLPHFNYLSDTDKTRILLNVESSRLIAQEVIGNFIKELYQERRKLTS